MAQNFEPGDFLVFQLEAGFALLRVLGIDDEDGQTVWHLAAYSDFFPDVDSAENAAAKPHDLKLTQAHLALTNRAFESTQVARIGNLPLSANEIVPLSAWRSGSDHGVSDRSVRLMLGLR